MRRSDREAAYTAFVLARQDHLRKVAFALCGDCHDADDLLQTALTKLYVAWSAGGEGRQPRGVRSYASWCTPTSTPLASSSAGTVSLESGAKVPGRVRLRGAEHADLIEAVQSLPEMQRKVVVLRHWLALDVRQTAHELGIAEGSVKSHSSRGLARLQKVLGEPVPT